MSKKLKLEKGTYFKLRSGDIFKIKSIELAAAPNYPVHAVCTEAKRFKVGSKETFTLEGVYDLDTSSNNSEYDIDVTLSKETYPEYYL